MRHISLIYGSLRLYKSAADSSPSQNYTSLGFSAPLSKSACGLLFEDRKLFYR